jgi:hypothetical protein
MMTMIMMMIIIINIIITIAFLVNWLDTSGLLGWTRSNDKIPQTGELSVFRTMLTNFQNESQGC